MLSVRTGEKRTWEGRKDHLSILYGFGIEQVLFVYPTSINCRIIKFN